MRYAFAIAGLAAAAQAGNTYTLTATEEVTITSCAPTHTNCPYKSQTNDWENWSQSADPTSTWGSWDPSKPSTTSKSGNGGDWNNWGANGDGKKTTYSKPATATGVNGDWNNWGYDDSDGKKTSTSANGDWNNWGADVDGKKTTSSKPATATGVNGEWNNWGSANGDKPASNTAACPSYTASAPPAWFSQLPSSVLSSLAAQWTGAPPKDWCYYSYSASSIVTKTPDATSTGAGEWNNWGAATSTPVKGASATGSGPIAKYTGAANANAASFILGGAAAIAAVILV